MDGSHIKLFPVITSNMSIINCCPFTRLNSFIIPDSLFTSFQFTNKLKVEENTSYEMIKKKKDNTQIRVIYNSFVLKLYTHNSFSYACNFKCFNSSPNAPDYGRRKGAGPRLIRTDWPTSPKVQQPMKSQYLRLYLHMR